MGLFDRFRRLFGSQAEADATRDADPDDLFQLTAASVTMTVDLDYEPGDTAGLVFSAMDSTDFQGALRDVEAVLEGSGWSSVHEDDHGYTWAVATRDGFEELVADIYVAADTLADRGYGDRLLAAVFHFEPQSGDQDVYWIYSFRRGSFYPFVPSGPSSRDDAREVKLQSVMDEELDVEEDTQYWYPLWPDRRGAHPWE
ncbi:hypothetical protein HTSR_2019 [Halodesulfurarchaeum formicicum]|uniref:Uncharacterized protein n=1 Tax=Halodesulfurarchaeum formicicum TaxID=1873524 RepID=A0A1D8S747_9EURY|nr:hypothetical protein [Halodesulfurarchaeum formicicum]AOW81180.1 hypothetical protein HTSR_2019 [Halodesulfurarchaeum formicicum]